MLIIYTKKDFDCKWCVKAASLLRENGYEEGKDFETIALEKEYLLQIAERYNMVSIPIIVRDEILLGGYDNLVKYVDEENRRTAIS